MKQTSRKKVLLSSVAMMMVATVSLGSATFAWFTSSTKTQTKNLQFKTTKSSTLQISSATSAWVSDGLDYELSTAKLMLPASTTLGTKSAGDWVAANAAKTTVGDASVDSVLKLTTDNVGNYVYMNQLNVRNAGDAAVDEVKIKFQIPATPAYNYLRVALVETSGQGEDVANTGTFTDSVYANNSSKYQGLKGTKVETQTDDEGNETQVTVLDTVDITPKDAAQEISIDVGKLNGVVTNDKDSDGSISEEEKTYSSKYYNLYIWFEGQDPDCKDENAGVVIPDIVFTVEGQTVTDTQ